MARTDAWMLARSGNLFEKVSQGPNSERFSPQRSTLPEGRDRGSRFTAFALDSLLAQLGVLGVLSFRGQESPCLNLSIFRRAHWNC
jgi:hypothetical protein